MNDIVICSNCGQKNRVNNVPDGSRAICTKCWATLNISQQPTRKPQINKSKRKHETTALKAEFRLLIAVGIIVLWIIFFINSDKSSNKQNSYTSSLSNQPSQTQENVPAYPEVKMPNNGEMRVYTSKQRIAPLEIETAYGTNYFVKIVNSTNQHTALTIFVRGGNTVSIEVPLGTYEIKYAAGEKWYGETYLFGPKTAYSKADKLFAFKDDGYQVSGYMIKLFNVSNGNLSTSQINAAQF